jgi:hypothetical protein
MVLHIRLALTENQILSSVACILCHLVWRDAYIRVLHVLQGSPHILNMKRIPEE